MLVLLMEYWYNLLMKGYREVGIICYSVVFLTLQ